MEQVNRFSRPIQRNGSGNWNWEKEDFRTQEGIQRERIERSFDVEPRFEISHDKRGAGNYEGRRSMRLCCLDLRAVRS
jgi:hypothetical protein